MKRFKPLIIVFGILFIPSIFFLVLKTGKNSYKRLEIFGPKEPAATITNGVPDTVYHNISSFSFTDQHGRTVSNETFKDKIYVADFFFAACKTICPQMSNQLVRVQEAFKNDSSVLILSYTVNPENDSVSALYDYSIQYKALKDKWFFATGDKKEIYDLARNSYFITAMEGNGGPDDFIHSEQFALIDKKGRIRGYYDGTDHFEVNRLIDEIAVLKLEYNKK